MLADGAGASRDGRVCWRLFFRIVNQVLVRLWARRWWEIRANGCLPLLPGASRVGGSRSLTGQGPIGWQHLVGYSLAIDGTCVQRRFGELLVVMANGSLCAS